MKADAIEVGRVYDKNLRSYALTLTLHHHLITSGHDEGPEIEAVEAGLASIWDRLTEEQRQEGRGISSDLNWLRRKYEPPPRGKKPEEVTPEELADFDRAVAAQDWLGGLRALRVCGAAKSKGLIAGWRANTYYGLNLPDVSEPFLRAAIELNKNNSTVCRSCFDLLIHANAAAALSEAIRIIRASEEYPPAVVASSVTFMLDYLGGQPTAFSRVELADKLRQAGKRLDQEPVPSAERASFYTMAGAQLLSFGYAEEAAQYFELGLEADPESPELYGWLGEAMYDTNRGRAVELFEQAVSMGAKLARPYLHLANHHLVERNFVGARVRAAQAAELARDNFGRGYALEILAISLAETGYASDVVLDLFRRAAELAPGNRRIQANAAAFEEFAAKRQSKMTWETKEAQPPLEARGKWVTEQNAGVSLATPR